MKKLLLTLVLLFSIASFAQEITLERGKYYVNGSQISTRETKKLLETNYKALRRFESGLSKESTGGFLIGLGGALVITDLVVGLVSDVHYPTAATYIGAGALVIAIPVLSGKNKKIKEGIDLYNSGLKNVGSIDSDFEVNFIGNQRGYGIQIRF
jgi:hypothetical protein